MSAALCLAGAVPGLDTERWARSAPIGAIRRALQATLLVQAVRALCAPLTVEIADGLPAEPSLLIANHASHLDAPLVLAALPADRRARTAPAAAADYFYRDALRGGAATLALGAFPFPRDRGCLIGLERAAALLAAGWDVLLFPEGTRSRDGRLGPFKRGAARLALATGVPVVPVGIDGAWTVLPPGARWPRRGPVNVRVGAAWTADPAAPIDRLVAQMQARVAALLAHTVEGDATWRSR